MLKLLVLELLNTVLEFLILHVVEVGILSLSKILELIDIIHDVLFEAFSFLVLNRHGLTTLLYLTCGTNSP